MTHITYGHANVKVDENRSTRKLEVRRESFTTVYMRDDWEKLSDEKSSLRACRRLIPNRSRVVSCESRIVHVLLPLPLNSLHQLHRTLYRRTHILPFFCASNVYTTSVVLVLAPCVEKCVKTFAKNLAKNLQVHKNSKGKIFLANMLEMVC